jgi:hypothetical protein
VLPALAVGIALAFSQPAEGDNKTDGWRLFAPISAQKVDPQPHPAVVRILVDEGRTLSNGSGSLVAARDQHGLVVTNWHVVRDANGKIQVVFPDGYRSEATLLKTDQEWDLAALLVWSPQVTPLPISTTAPQPGDVLTIAGYGQGAYRAVSGKCTQYVAPSLKHPYEIVELSAEARQGDSGGPILNSQNELAGVLFGSSRGSTSGSYCGRVRWFLSSVWPELDLSSAQHPRSMPLVGYPAAEPATEATPAPNLVPILPAEPPAEPSTQVAPVPQPPPEIAVSAPYSSLPPLPAASSNSSWNWNQLAGTTRWDQAKSLLAVIGLLAIWGQMSRWLTN